MIFNSKEKNNQTKFLFVAAIIFFLLIVIYNKPIYRSIYTINLGSLYVNYLDLKIKLGSLLNNESRTKVYIEMSPKNFSLIQNEREKRVNNYIFTGEPFVSGGDNYKIKLQSRKKTTKAKMKLFGMMPDHYRGPYSHSFRLSYNGGSGFGKKKVNFSKPRSNDFNIDFILNLIYNDLHKGIRINYEPVDVKINKIDYGTYLKYDFFDKYLIEGNDFRDGFIFEKRDHYFDFNHIPEELENKENYIFNFTEYFNDELKFVKQIDYSSYITILSFCLALNDSSAHLIGSNNMHWYYNPVINLFSPTVREGFVYQNRIFNSSNIAELEKKNSIENMFDKISFDNLTMSFINYYGRKKVIGDIQSQLIKIKESFERVKKSNEYTEFKDKLSGLESFLVDREKIFYRNLNFLNKFPLIEKEFNKGDKYSFSNNLNISNDIIVSENDTLVFENFKTITLTNNAKIIVNGGSLIIKGENNKTSKFVVIGDSNSSIFVKNSKNVIIENTSFERFSSLKDSFWNLPSALTFYESRVIINNCIFNNNLKGDDYINFFRCNEVTVNNSVFSNVLSDAIDTDFSKITIKNCFFDGIGNDAVDGSGSFADISNSQFKNVSDKSISAGENSIFYVKNNNFIDSELGIVTKDGSKIESSNNNFENLKIDFVAFIKKRFYKGPTLILKEENSNLKSLIEKNTNLIGLDSTKYYENVESLLYGNEFGKATIKE